MKIDKDGIQVFYSADKEYGGFNHFIARLFRWKLGFLDICWHKWKGFKNVYRDEESYYEVTYYNCIVIGFFTISYSTSA